MAPRRVGPLRNQPDCATQAPLFERRHKNAGMTVNVCSERFSAMRHEDKAAHRSDAVNEQRKFPRVSLGLLIQIRASSIEEFTSFHCENISTGGMFLRTTQRRPLGTEVFFQFTVAGGGTLIEGLGKVVRITDDGMGLEFVSLLEPSASIVTKLVNDRLQGA